MVLGATTVRGDILPLCKPASPFPILLGDIADMLRTVCRGELLSVLLCRGQARGKSSDGVTGRDARSRGGAVTVVVGVVQGLLLGTSARGRIIPFQPGRSRMRIFPGPEGGVDCDARVG